MTEKRDNGGPAFPSAFGGQFCIGMSLRDYFAGQALAGMMSIRVVVDNEGESLIAMAAYQHADAMLRERAKT